MTLVRAPNCTSPHGIQQTKTNQSIDFILRGGACESIETDELVAHSKIELKI